MTNAIRTLG
ncbi:hypothetical protein D046_5802A, partial [Vibrio parahaemolyticus V-223/04]